MAEKEVYCGSILSEKELVEFDVEQIRVRLGYDVEKPRSPLNLHPQASIRFMIVFFDLSKDLKEFGVESTGKIEEVE